MKVTSSFVPSFIAEDNSRVEFTLTISGTLFTFTCEWWDNLWHCTIAFDTEKRSCILYPNAVYFPLDSSFQLQFISTLSSIGLNDLSDMSFKVATSD